MSNYLCISVPDEWLLCLCDHAHGCSFRAAKACKKNWKFWTAPCLRLYSSHIKAMSLFWQLDCRRLKLIENIHQLLLLDLLMQSTEKKCDVLRLNGSGNTGELHPYSETLLQSLVHSMLCLSRFTAVDLHLRIYLSLTLVH